MDALHTRNDARWPSILLIVGTGVVSACQVGKAPAALAAIQADLALDLGTASWLLSAFAIVGALTGITIGVAVDHVGARFMALGGLLLQGGGSAIGALANDAPLLLAMRAVEGVGFLAVSVAGPTLIVAVARSSDHSRAMAMWGTFMPIGMSAVLIATPLLDALGWRGFWLVNAALLIGYAALLVPATRGIPARMVPVRSIARVVRLALSASGPWLLAGLFAFFAAAYFAVFAFLPAILSERLSVDTRMGGQLTGIAVSVNALGNLACGALLSRGVAHRTILLVGFGAMAVCSIGVLSGALSGALVYTASIVFSALAGLIPVALIHSAPRMAPCPELIGATIGFLMQGNNAGLVFGPAAAGALAVAHGWPTVSLLVVSLATAASLLAVSLHLQQCKARTRPSSVRHPAAVDEL